MGVLLVLLLLALFASSAQAASPPLGTADTFAVLAGSTVTNTGPSVISGDLGLSPGTSVTGFPPGTVTGGTIHATDAVAAQAQSDLTTAYNVFAGQPSSATISTDLAGQRLTSGVYTSSTSMPGLALSGDLTLDAQNDPNALFVFQAKSTLIVGSGSHVNLINGAQPCNVYWQVGSSATIGAGTTFVGNILALTSISLNTTATLNGSALARNGAVTLDTNRVTKAPCSTPTRVAPVTTDTSTSTGGPVSVVLRGSDSTGAPLTYAITRGPSSGSLGPIDQTSATVTYTPNSGYSGPDSFTYRATSTNGTSNTATATITVTPVIVTPPTPVVTPPTLVVTSPAPVGTPPAPVGTPPAPVGTPPAPPGTPPPTPIATQTPILPPASTSTNRAEAKRKAEANRKAAAKRKAAARRKAAAKRKARARARARVNAKHPRSSYGFTG